MQPGRPIDAALPPPTHAGLNGTILCAACGFHGIGSDHPESCVWEVLKDHPDEYERALAAVELGPRASAAIHPVS